MSYELKFDVKKEYKNLENKPFKGELSGKWSLGGEWNFLPENWFPEVKWSDSEPTKVKLEIVK